MSEAAPSRLAFFVHPHLPSDSLTPRYDNERRLDHGKCMATIWHLAEPWRDTEAGRLFASMDRAFAVRGEIVATSSLSDVRVVRTEGAVYYVKRYFRGGKRLRRFIGRSRIEREFKNLENLRGFGIPCARTVAFGLERRCGCFRRGVLVTEEIAGAADLSAMPREHPELFAQRAWRGAVSRQLAGYLRRMHERRFIYVDLKWRNILVSLGSEPLVSLIDCPAGAIRPFFDFHCWKRKELGRLDLPAREHLTRSERLRFFKRYCGRDRLTPADRRLLRWVAAYHD